MFTMTAVCNEVDGTDWHDNEADDEVGHGETHDEHVADGVETALGADGVQHHPVPHSRDGAQQEEPQPQQQPVRLQTTLN